MQLPPQLPLPPALDVDALVQRQADEVEGLVHGGRHDGSVRLLMVVVVCVSCSGLSVGGTLEEGNGQRTLRPLNLDASNPQPQAAKIGGLFGLRGACVCVCMHVAGRVAGYLGWIDRFLVVEIWGRLEAVSDDESDEGATRALR